LAQIRTTTVEVLYFLQYCVYWRNCSSNVIVTAFVSDKRKSTTLTLTTPPTVQLLLLLLLQALAHSPAADCPSTTDNISAANVLLYIRRLIEETGINSTSDRVHR